MKILFVILILSFYRPILGASICVTDPLHDDTYSEAFDDATYCSDLISYAISDVTISKAEQLHDGNQYEPRE